MDALFTKITEWVKGLTLTNVAVIAILALILIPGWFVWKITNDPELMGMVFSNFEEVPSVTDCNLFRAQAMGGPVQWAVTNQFAERNAEFWAVSVKIKFKPDAQAVKAYCASLEQIVRYMHDPDLQPPTFPGSERSIVWREYHPGKDGP